MRWKDQLDPDRQIASVRIQKERVVEKGKIHPVLLDIIPYPMVEGVNKIWKVHSV